MSGNINFFQTLPWFLDLWVLAIKKAYHILDTNSKHTLFFWKTLPQPSRLVSYTWWGRCVFNRLFRLISLFPVLAQLIQDGGEHVGLFCCHIWKSAAVVAGEPWWMVVHTGKSMCNFSLCDNGHIVHRLFEQWQEWLGKEADLYSMGHPTYLIIEFFLSWSHLLMSIFMGDKHLYIFCLFAEIYPQTSSLDVFLMNF